MSTSAGSSPNGGTASPDRTTHDTTDFVRKLALAVGAVFLLVGILGFVPGITQNLGDMAFAGDNSNAKLLGLFQVSVLHNIVHLLFGVAGIAMSRQTSTARTYLLVGGAIYLVLWVYGLIVAGGDGSSGANFVPLNGADNWLHLLLGIGMIVMGMLGRRDATAPTTTA